ncbi:MAG: hypothetical protein JW715_08900 [Sedimentisphaerales bacterium]|nr:hypothetical protein [Sedimentisphaerales bacterium]
MKIRISLLKILFRQTLPATLIALPVGCFYVLLTKQVLSWRNPWMALFVLVHSIAIAVMSGRYRSKTFAFLYTRGFTRDELWCNKMLNTTFSVLTVWLPVALIIWLPIRSAVQDKLFVSPYFPIMMMREASVPWVWLGGYAILLPLFHYVWIRRAQPLRGGSGVILLAISVVIVIGILMLFRRHPLWFRFLIYVLSTVMIAASLIAGRILHRNLEVQ